MPFKIICKDYSALMPCIVSLCDKWAEIYLYLILICTFFMHSTPKTSLEILQEGSTVEYLPKNILGIPWNFCQNFCQNQKFDI